MFYIAENQLVLIRSPIAKNDFVFLKNIYVDYSFSDNSNQRIDFSSMEFSTS